MSKTLYLEDRTIRLQLWDTAGQERFRTLIPSYIRDSAVTIIVYDVCSTAILLNSSVVLNSLIGRASFEAIDRWIEDVKNERGEGVIIVLVGNKSDLSEKRYLSSHSLLYSCLNCRQVATEEGEKRSAELNCMFLETSAKTGFNVKGLFTKIAQSLPNETQNGPPDAINTTQCISYFLYSANSFFVSN